MNYELARLLGHQNSRLLTATQVLSWTLIQSMYHDSIVKQESQRALAHVLSTEILKHIPVSQREREDGLYFTAETYVHSPAELQELLGKAYQLGTESARPVPNYSQF